jgi:hypothetical protein
MFYNFNAFALTRAEKSGDQKLFLYLAVYLHSQCLNRTLLKAGDQGWPAAAGFYISCDKNKVRPKAGGAKKNPVTAYHSYDSPTTLL